MIGEIIPVFQEIVPEGKKSKKLFRYFGQVRVIDSHGKITIYRESGYERAYPRTYKKVSKNKTQEKTT